MKITAFNPAILTTKPDEALALFEALGFSKRHQNVDIQDEPIKDNYRLKDENGFYVDINHFDNLPQDVTLIRMNVDDFDEGYALLKRHGFRNALGEGQFVETPFLKGAHMVSPSGFAIMLMKHIKR